MSSQPILIPDSETDLTASWFTQVLEKETAGAVVRTVDLEPIGVGAGMMSRLFRASLGYGTGQGPGSVVVKLPTGNEQNKTVAVTFDNYRREVEFYRRSAHATPMRTPKSYLAEHCGADSFALVLEDLSDWSQGDQVIGCELDRAEAVMDALADLHGAFWNRVDGEDMRWLPDTCPSVMSDGLATGTEASWDDFVRVFDDMLTDELKTAKSAYLKGLPGVQAHINASPRTIIHGDFRMDNLFFRSENTGIEVACCDWQAPVRGKGIHDIAYFLSGSIDTEMRRHHEINLIERWLESLRQHGVSDYDVDQAFADYKLAILMLWTYVVVVGGGLAAENERGTSWVTAMVERSTAAMTDHNCLSLL